MANSTTDSDRDARPMGLFQKLFLILFVTGLIYGSFTLLWVSKNHTTPIMMYHHIGYSPVPKANWVSPETFERHMAFLAANKFIVLSMDDFIDLKMNGRPIPKKSVVITFDDGYENNYINALPILERYKFPATVFMPSDFIGEDGFLSLQQLKVMMEKGIEIGSHTQSQAYLPDLQREEMKREIVNSKTVLERALDTEVEYFAYPIGGFSEQIKRIVREAGYRAAFATNRGYDKENKDLYELNRIRFNDDNVDTLVLWAKLSGYYNLFRTPKNPY